MAAEERGLERRLCVKVWMEISKPCELLSHFYFPHGERASSHTCASFPDMHCFSQAIICSSVCFQSVFLLFQKKKQNKAISLVLKLCLHSWHGPPGCAPIMQCLTPMMPLLLFFFFFFCANTHNSSWFNLLFLPPRFCPPPFSQPLGLIAQDLSLLPLSVVRLKHYYF